MQVTLPPSPQPSVKGPQGLAPAQKQDAEGQGSFASLLSEMSGPAEKLASGRVDEKHEPEKKSEKAKKDNPKADASAAAAQGAGASAKPPAKETAQAPTESGDAHETSGAGAVTAQEQATPAVHAAATAQEQQLPASEGVLPDATKADSDAASKDAKTQPATEVKAGEEILTALQGKDAGDKPEKATHTEPAMQPTGVEPATQTTGAESSAQTNAPIPPTRQADATAPQHPETGAAAQQATQPLAGALPEGVILTAVQPEGTSHAEAESTHTEATSDKESASPTGSDKHTRAAFQNVLARLKGDGGQGHGEDTSDSNSGHQETGSSDTRSEVKAGADAGDPVTDPQDSQAGADASMLDMPDATLPPDLLQPLHQHADEALSSLSGTTPSARTSAGVFARPAMAAAWVRAALAQQTGGVQTTDGWQTLSVDLDGGGQVTVKARRDDDRMNVSVGFSNPRLHAQVQASAHQIEQTLEAQYQKAVNLSFHAGGQGGGEPGDRRNQSSGPATGVSVSAETEVKAARPQAQSAVGLREWVV